MIIILKTQIICTDSMVMPPMYGPVVEAPGRRIRFRVLEPRCQTRIQNPAVTDWFQTEAGKRLGGTRTCFCMSPVGSQHGGSRGVSIVV